MADDHKIGAEIGFKNQLICVCRIYVVYIVYIHSLEIPL